MLTQLRILAAAVLAGCALQVHSLPSSSAGLLAVASAASPRPVAARAAHVRPLTFASHPRGERASSTPAAVRQPRAQGRLPQSAVTRAVARQARIIIDAHGRDPFGTEIPFDADGRTYIARIERHYHPPGGDKRPWGHHPGVSVFVTDADAASFAGR